MFKTLALLLSLLAVPATYVSNSSVLTKEVNPSVYRSEDEGVDGVVDVREIGKK